MYKYYKPNPVASIFPILADAMFDPWVYATEVSPGILGITEAGLWAANADLQSGKITLSNFAEVANMHKFNVTRAKPASKPVSPFLWLGLAALLVVPLFLVKRKKGWNIGYVPLPDHSPFRG